MTVLPFEREVTRTILSYTLEDYGLPEGITWLESSGRRVFSTEDDEWMVCFLYIDYKNIKFYQYGVNLSSKNNTASIQQTLDEGVKDFIVNLKKIGVLE